MKINLTDPDTRAALATQSEPNYRFSATPQETAFARMLAQGESLPVAFREAGFGTGLTDPQCWTRGARLAKTKRITERIHWFQELIDRKFDVREERVMAELAAVAFSDPADFVTPANEPVAIHDLPRSARAAISQIDMGERPDGSSFLRLRLNDKMKALQALVKIKNMEAAHQANAAPTIQIGFKTAGQTYEHDDEET